VNAKELWQLAENLFSKRQSLMSLWQETSEHFYPERADFTYKRTLGTDFAGNLMSSYPMLARRELANQVGAMLRPANQEWFYMVRGDQEDRVVPDHEGRLWLEWANNTMRRHMYNRQAMFARATTEADNDWSTFGQYVMSIRVNNVGNALLYRNWHLRDCCWMENEEGRIVFFARRWKPHARELVRLFGDKVHSEVKKLSEKTPFQTVDCVHIVCESDLFDGDSRGMPYHSIYLDVQHEGSVIEEMGQVAQEYIVARWQTVSDSQYAYSPSTVAALPDARLIQAMTMTLLEAGEKVTNPPMIATVDAVKSDVSIYAGGITWIDRDYDEKLGEALRPMTRDYARGLPYGAEMLQATQAMIHQAFYLNKLTLPERAPEMTAYEVGQRIQEYIRGALPLFEPMEHESNGQICEETFSTLMRAGAFGSPLDMPRSLRGADVQFKYRSPLHDAIEAQKAQIFREGAALLAEAAAVDPTTPYMIDAPTALRESLQGLGVDEDWLRSEDETRQLAEKAQQQQEQQQMLMALEQGSKVAANFSQAEKANAEAQR